MITKKEIQKYLTKIDSQEEMEINVFDKNDPEFKDFKTDGDIIIVFDDVVLSLKESEDPLLQLINWIIKKQKA